MRKATYLYSNLRYLFLMSLFALILCMGKTPGSIAKEKPVSIEQQTKKLQDDKSKKSDEKSISDDDVKLWLKQIEIYGQIAKPQTVFIIPGTDPRVDGLRIDRHFFSHIFRPVEKSTLRRVRMKQGKDKDHILW
jgi:hypothetical protein